MLKLRIRCLESRQTLKISIQTNASFENLKDTIAEKISSLSSSSQSLHLSLNRQDEIIAASPNDSLTSLGIASGDLIYYTLNTNGFSSNQVSTQSFMDIDKNNETFDDLKVAHVENSGIQETGIEKNVEKIEDEGMEEDLDIVVKKFSSVPCFLQKVYKEEVGGSGAVGDYNKLLMIAVHAVFLESGFVCFDSVTKKKMEGFRLPEEGKSRVRYTAPDLLDGAGDGDEVFEIVDLKFSTLGKFVNVHGFLSRNSVDMFRACLDKSCFAPSVEFVCMLNCGLAGEEKEMDESLKSSHEKKVFELWKIVKDDLALPLLINLCEKNGLGSPPCFSVLPTDLKLKILEFVSGTDLATVGCVSSELRYLSSNNDLWKQKYVEEFSLVDSGDASNCNWKEKFVICRERNKKKVRPYFLPFTQPRLPYFVRGGREPRPFGFPGIIGGDYDLFPAPFGSNLGLRLPARKNFVRHCNLDGFDA